MLQLLTVRNLALVEFAQLEPGPGLTVLTGETGAGKSVLVSALGLIVGGRASADAIRSGADEAEVEALFSVPPSGTLHRRLEAAGIAHEGELLVRRTVGSRSRAYLNGRLATVSMLQDILRGVVELTSQHEHVALLDSETHIDLLDRWAGALPSSKKVAYHYGEVEGYRRLLASIDEDEATRVQREDFLRFALDELIQLDPQLGETEALEVERERLRRCEELQEGLHQALIRLGGDEGVESSVVEALGGAQSRLERLAGIDPELAPLAETAARLLAEADELTREVRGMTRRGETDPERLTQVEDRLDALRRLQRKYGGSEDAVLAARRRMEEELDQIEHEDVRRTDLLAALEAEQAALREAARELSGIRRARAPALAQAIGKELKDLHMADGRLEFELIGLSEPGPGGQEAVELRFSAHSGEPLRPLRKVASGGELSRLMLAIKQVQSEGSEVAVQVFDEVDAGLGGGAAEALGAKLQAASQAGQVLCITHLAQVAARAHTQILVEKRKEGERVTTGVRRLEREARVEELARMLGAKVTSKSRSLAKELLLRAQMPQSAEEPDEAALGGGSRVRRGRSKRTSTR